jgi:hypothetical protein
MEIKGIEIKDEPTKVYFIKASEKPSVKNNSAARFYVEHYRYGVLVNENLSDMMIGRLLTEDAKRLGNLK